MSDYIISACSTADLTKEQFEKYDVKYVCFHVNIDSETYPDDLGQSMPFKTFYDRMREGADTSTSQVNPEQYINFFTPFLEEGKDILHLTLSSGISGTYNSAMIAKEELEEQYPDRKIYVIDSLDASVGYGLLMEELSERRAAGATIDEQVEWIDENKLKVQHWVLVSDLKWLVKGGRVSKTSGVLGSMLNICPVIDVNYEGKLINRAKIRTKKKAISYLVDMMMQNAENGTEYDGKCYIGHSDCIEDAEALTAMIEEKFPKMKGKVVINSIGTVIGSHTGPGTMVVVYTGKTRTAED